ncbi:class I SAM-dependent methyltransferase [Segnochrobactrum spirostomi]|uniref:class I SAM-dependent methyltransferase n=1 Tax=Segnochrobactrum spirostomi TaxID=2608987 RepID=UPI0028A95DFF|nr:class I SAM-dependent methyltransferase [Segnochrobactrum spirostomi]
MRDALYDDPALVSFYDLENGGPSPDRDCCLALAGKAASVLDLGCGTGELAVMIASAADGRVGRAVFGVDPAGAMLDNARSRPGGAGVTWVEADARTVRLGRTFDLVVLTGHAFQVFLTEQDRAALLATIAVHLSPAGRFVFDSRNPAAEEWREWTPDRSHRLVAHPDFGAVEAWNDVEHDPVSGIVTYGTFYRIVESGRLLSSRSRIAFPARDEIARLIAAAALAVETWLGDWNGTPFTPASPEIIPLGRRAL